MECGLHVHDLNLCVRVRNMFKCVYVCECVFVHTCADPELVRLLVW